MGIMKLGPNNHFECKVCEKQVFWSKFLRKPALQHQNRMRSRSGIDEMGTSLSIENLV